MKLSSRCTYAIRAMFDIAFHGNDLPIAGREIARREDIPQRFLEQILLQLRKAKLVVSRRGPAGGYMLSRDADSITFFDIVEAIDGLAEMEDAPSAEDLVEGSEIASKQVTSLVWTDMVERIRDQMRTETLGDMVKRAEKLRVYREGSEPLYYVI